MADLKAAAAKPVSPSTPASGSISSRPLAPRPLSPHLQIYRWTWTMAMSVAHRLTGVALYGGTLIVAAGLLSIICGKSAYETFQMIATSIPGKLVLFGYTWALMHHMMGGLRHFIWDMGLGYEAHTRQALAYGSLIASVTLTIAIWAAAWGIK